MDHVVYHDLTKLIEDGDGDCRRFQKCIVIIFAKYKCSDREGWRSKCCGLFTVDATCISNALLEYEIAVVRYPV